VDRSEGVHLDASALAQLARIAPVYRTRNVTADRRLSFADRMASRAMGASGRDMLSPKAGTVHKVRAAPRTEVSSWPH
jgi:hypothetical protein